MALKNNTWKLNQWYDQAVAGNADYSGLSQLWTLGGYNDGGQLGQNNNTNYSSPIQIPGTTWSQGEGTFYGSAVIRTDGTLWVWGENNTHGTLGLNNRTNYSSPVQIPGTTWKNVSANGYAFHATKTDGTLWSWGRAVYGVLGNNLPDNTRLSSPTQIPGTTWDIVYANDEFSTAAIKTDGTLWCWGSNERGQLGLNSNGDDRSSPVQVPGTTWSKGQYGSSRKTRAAIKTDGTLWTWGWNNGGLGQNNLTQYSSPVQVPGTTWSTVSLSYQSTIAVKTDGTLWAWGDNGQGQLGDNQTNPAEKSSPIQIGSGTDWSLTNSKMGSHSAIQTF